MAFVFVRHGESVANAEGWLAGAVDTPLTERGRQQAIQARSALPEGIVRAWSSDLSRARDTALLLLEGRGLALRQAPELRERDLGPWAHQARGDFSDFHLFLTWDDAPEGAETQADIASRVLAWLAELPEVRGHTLVVAHGGVLRVVLGLLDGVPLAEIGSHKVANCEVQVRHVQPGRFRALAQEHRR